MAIKITKKIKSYSVNKPEGKAAESAPVAVAAMPATAEIIHMHEKVERPEALVGATYKIKAPLVEHAMYVTINDIVLNPGTDHELRRPFEVFINSKNLDLYQWIVALTRIISAVFRKGGDVTFMVEELKAVFDPQGGYFKRGRFMPSLVAELGEAIEQQQNIFASVTQAGCGNFHRRKAEIQVLAKCFFNARLIGDLSANRNHPHTRCIAFGRFCRNCIKHGHQPYLHGRA